MSTSKFSTSINIDTEIGNDFDYACPNCGRTHNLAVRALIWTELLPDGSDPDGDTPDHDHYWDDDHEAHCMDCGWHGLVGNL